MFCKQCGSEIKEESSFCAGCGSEVIPLEKREKFDYPKPPKDTVVKKFTKFFGFGFLVFVVLLIRVVISYVNTPDYESVNKNDEAIEQFIIGDSTSALAGLEEALSSAEVSENKMNILKNLAYVLTNEGRKDEAILRFKEALEFAENDEFETNLIKGEIAYLEWNFPLAESLYLKAHDLNPTEFQINNALALFYLDLEVIAPDFEDYPSALEYALLAKKYARPDVQDIVDQNLAIAYYFNNYYQEAISLWLTQDTSDPINAYWLGWAYVANNQENVGIPYLKKAVASGLKISQEEIDYINSF